MVFHFQVSESKGNTFSNGVPPEPSTSVHPHEPSYMDMRHGNDHKKICQKELCLPDICQKRGDNSTCTGKARIGRVPSDARADNPKTRAPGLGEEEVLQSKGAHALATSKALAGSQRPFDPKATTDLVYQGNYSQRFDSCNMDSFKGGK